jgi:fibronectin type 3 domain-containing protein
MGKYLALLLAVFMAFLSACPNPSGGSNGGNDEEPPQSELPQGGKTLVYFVNGNDFSVTVYENSSRDVKIVDVAANSKSEPVATAPNPNAVFYPSYHILIEDVEFPYNDHRDILVRIDAEKTTKVLIPSLFDLESDDLAKPITAGVHIKIQNSGNYALTLMHGNFEEIPQGTNSPVVNREETAWYQVTLGSVSDYSFMENSEKPINFPAGLTELLPGHFYSFRYEGSRLTLLGDKPIAIAQALEILPPENISAKSLANGHISLTWDKAGTETVYVIYRSESETGPCDFIGRTEVTSYTDTTVAIDASYYYRISSVKGNIESNKSTTVVFARAALPSPEGLKITDQTANSISFSWQAVPDATSYKIYKGLISENVNEYVTEISSSSYTITGLAPNTNYYFTIIAVSESGESLPSAAVQGSTPDDRTIPLPPAKPAGLAVSDARSGSVSLSWNSTANADSYSIYRTNSQNGTPEKIGSVTQTSYTDSTASAGEMYYYSVRAVNPSGNSSDSNRVFAYAVSHYDLLTYAASSRSLSGGSKHYYRLAVSAGQSYTITWQDGSNQNASSSVLCTAWQNDGTTIFTNAYYGYTSPKTFTAAEDGYVTVEVRNTKSTTYTYNYKIYYQDS